MKSRMNSPHPGRPVKANVLSVNGVLLLTVLALATVAATTQAATTNQAYYKLGEAGSYNADNANSPLDATANAYNFSNVNSHGAGIDTTTHAPVSTSTASFHFTEQPSGYYQSGGFTLSSTANYGVEVWFKAASADLNQTARWIFGTGLDGDTTGGLGIYLESGNIRGIAPGVNYVGVAPVVADQWTEAAIVTIDNQGIFFYVNGNLVLQDPNHVASTPSTLWNLATNYNGTSSFTGWLDEARVFTWTGSFNPATDLNIPEPAMLTCVLLGAGSLLLRRRRQTR